MDAEALLQQLVDIRPPLEPAWWQLSPAMLSLGAVVLLALLLVAVVYYRRRRNHLLELATRELRQIADRVEAGDDERELALALNAWLKRVAVTAFPEREPGALCGQAWLEFLDHSSGAAQFSSGAGRAFADAVYQARPAVAAPELLGLCETWLQVIKPRLQRRSH